MLSRNKKKVASATQDRLPDFTKKSLYRQRTIVEDISIAPQVTCAWVPLT
jgi:hypothetical protein